MNDRSSAVVGSLILLLMICVMHTAATAGEPDFRNALLSGAQEDSSKIKVVRKKSPNGAMLRSLLFPGWGQLYNNQKTKAILVVAAQGTLIAIAVHHHNRAKENVANPDEHEFYIDKRNQTFWFMGGVTLLSMLDAYIDAYLYDFDAGPELELHAGFIKPMHSYKSVAPPIGFSIRVRF